MFLTLAEINSRIKKNKILTHKEIGQILLQRTGIEILITNKYLENYVIDVLDDPIKFKIHVEKILASHKEMAIEKLLKPIEKHNSDISILKKYIMDSCDNQIEFSARLEKILASHDVRAIEKSLPYLTHYILSAHHKTERTRRIEVMLLTRNSMVIEKILLPYLTNYINTAPNEEVGFKRIEKVLSSRNSRAIKEILLPYFKYYVGKSKDKKEYCQRVEKILSSHNPEAIQEILLPHLINYLNCAKNLEQLSEHVKRILASANLVALETILIPYLINYISNLPNKKEHSQYLEQILNLSTYRYKKQLEDRILNAIEKINQGRVDTKTTSYTLVPVCSKISINPFYFINTNSSSSFTSTFHQNTMDTSAQKEKESALFN